MTGSTARRREHGEDAIYFDATKNRYVGAVPLGFGPDGSGPAQGHRPNQAGGQGQIQGAARRA